MVLILTNLEYINIYFELSLSELDFLRTSKCLYVSYP